MAVWFTADSHFGHERIIELAQRPFESVDEMDEVMIERWNKRVRPGDLVYHVGDFALSANDIYLPRLNGQKRLVRGNHDHKNRAKLSHGWSTINGLLEIKVDDQRIVLCHYGMRVWNQSHRGAIHLYGHSHDGLPGDSQSLDVGVDCWDFRPVNLDEIRFRLSSLPARVEPDHHQPAESADG